MHNSQPRAPELKALLARLQTNPSSTKKSRVRAEVTTTEIIALLQRQSRFKK
jgi:hypothetical protein